MDKRKIQKTAVIYIIFIIFSLIQGIVYSFKNPYLSQYWIERTKEYEESYSMFFAFVKDEIIKQTNKRGKKTNEITAYFRLASGKNKCKPVDDGRPEVLY